MDRFYLVHVVNLSINASLLNHFKIIILQNSQSLLLIYSKTSNKKVLILEILNLQNIYLNTKVFYSRN